MWSFFMPKSRQFDLQLQPYTNRGHKIWIICTVLEDLINLQLARKIKHISERENNCFIPTIIVFLLVFVQRGTIHLERGFLLVYFLMNGKGFQGNLLQIQSSVSCSDTVTEIREMSLVIALSMLDSFKSFNVLLLSMLLTIKFVIKCKFTCAYCTLV